MATDMVQRRIATQARFLLAALEVEARNDVVSSGPEPDGVRVRALYAQQLQQAPRDVVGDVGGSGAMRLALRARQSMQRT